MKQQEPKPRDPELIAIGERARLAREAQGLSREKLAEAAESRCFNISKNIKKENKA